MNSMTKSRIYLPIAALILAALVVPAAAQNLVPFKGAIQGQETHSGEFPIITANGSCTGIATVVGKLSLTYQDTIDLRTASGTGIGQLIAANGDNIYLTWDRLTSCPHPVLRLLQKFTQLRVVLADSPEPKGVSLSIDP